MEPLTIFFQKNTFNLAPVSVVADLLKTSKFHPISFTPWAAFPYKPEVQFAISYNQNSILLQYQISEKFIKATHSKINKPVYEDSCVEFFISFDNSGYYNFEFNCIGTVLAGYGKERNNRELITENLLQKLRYQVILNREDFNNLISWELTVVIPFQTFSFHSISSLTGKECRANFYKCGDELPEPHFLSWTHIESEDPDFHLPQYFGTLLFK